MLSYFCLIRWSFVPAPYCPRKHRMLVLMNKISRQIAIRTIVAFVAMSVAVSEAGAADAEDEAGLPPGTLTVTVENDRVVNTDRHYTNGLRLSWVSDKETGGPDIVRDTLDFLYPLADVSGGRIGFALGQSMFTPEDTSARQLIADDRPYAGWLYGAVSLYAEADWKTETGFRYTTLDSVELNFGVVGPSSFADETQNGWHEIIGVSRSNGWENQLEDEPAVALFFERKWRPAAFEVGGIEADLIPQAGGSLGNVFTLANVGFTVRVGENLETDFGPPQIRPAFSGPGAVEPDTDFAWYLFAGVQANAVGHNIFLDGNTFTDSHSVDRKPFVGDFQTGAAVVFNDIRIAATHVLRTREFEGQRTPDRFGIISLSYHF